MKSANKWRIILAMCAGGGRTVGFFCNFEFPQNPQFLFILHDRSVIQTRSSEKYQNIASVLQIVLRNIVEFF
jgi:hypothetical protein